MPRSTPKKRVSAPKQAKRYFAWYGLEGDERDDDNFGLLETDGRTPSLEDMQSLLEDAINFKDCETISIKFQEISFECFQDMMTTAGMSFMPIN